MTSPFGPTGDFYALAHSVILGSSTIGSVSGQIPVPSRERLLAAARQRLGGLTEWPSAVVPVAADGWKRSLADAGVSGSDRLLVQQFDRLLDPASLTDGGSLRESSMQLADSVAVAAEALACLAARLAVESPELAARAVTWLALNDVIHAYADADETRGPIRRRVAQLAAQLQLAIISLSTTAPTLPAAASPFYTRRSICWYRRLPGLPQQHGVSHRGHPVISCT